VSRSLLAHRARHCTWVGRRRPSAAPPAAQARQPQPQTLAFRFTALRCTSGRAGPLRCVGAGARIVLLRRVKGAPSAPRFEWRGWGSAPPSSWEVPRGLCPVVVRRRGPRGEPTPSLHRGALSSSQAPAGSRHHAVSPNISRTQPSPCSPCCAGGGRVRTRAASAPAETVTAAAGAHVGARPSLALRPRRASGEPASHPGRLVHLRPKTCPLPVGCAVFRGGAARAGNRLPFGWRCAGLTPGRARGRWVAQSAFGCARPVSPKSATPGGVGGTGLYPGPPICYNP